MVVTGDAAPGALVGLYDATGLIGGATADPASGAWTAYVSLLAGTYSLYATETVSGAQIGISATVSVTVDSNELVNNGSFEEPAVGGPPSATYPPDPNSGVTGDWENYPLIPGWPR